MTRAVIGLATAAAMVLLVTGCGKSSTSTGSINAATVPPPNLIGVFTDAPVVNLYYVTSSASGGCTLSAPCLTDSLGQFKYAAGDTVSFYTEGYFLGSVAPTVATDGTATVTPLSLVPGASSVTDATVTTIASFLSTLNAISVAKGKGASGVYVMPNDTALATQLAALGVFNTANLQTAVNALYPTLGITVPKDADAQAALQLGINSKGIVGTVWSGTCSTCGASGGSDSGIFYFQPNGNLVGFTQSGANLSGAWSPASSGGVTFSLFGSAGGYTKAGSIAAAGSSGSADLYSSGDLKQGTYTFTKVSSATALSSTAYLGGWYASFAPNAAGTAAGYGTGGSAYFIAAPDGKLYAITNDGAYFSGTWNTATGTGSATGKSASISVTLASATGSVTSNGQSVGTLTLARTGSFSLTPATGIATAIPLLLNVSTSWANTATSVSGFALSLNVFDAKGALVANGIKTQSTGPRTDGTRTTTTDTFSVSYPRGGASSYSLQVDSAALKTPCTIANGAGTVTDTSSGIASAYSTVTITCN